MAYPEDQESANSAVHANETDSDEFMRGPEDREFRLSTNESVVSTPSGVFRVRYGKKGDEHWEIIIDGAVVPRRRLIVENETLFECQVGDETVTLSLRRLHDMLSSTGKVMKRARAPDILSALSQRMCEETIRTWPTAGIYPDGNVLALCEAPHPRTPSQTKAWAMMKPWFETTIQKEDFESFLEFISYYHAFEVLPLLGLSVAASATPVLRGAGILVPHVLSWSTESDLGKSLVATAFTKGMWGVESISGPSVDSGYRLADTFDSGCFALAIEEADRLKAILHSVLKEAAERWLADKRGTPDLLMIDYMARAVIFLTGNRPFVAVPPVLKRFLVIRYDPTVKAARLVNSRRVEECHRRLRPIGPAVSRRLVQMYPTSEKLLGRVRELTEELRAHHNGWVSPKRPEAWAVAYVGLEVFAAEADANGVSWSMPSVNAFVHDVVEPVEESTCGVRRSVVSYFVSWLPKYIISLTRLRGGGGEDGLPPAKEVLGEGELFREDTVDVRGQAIPGWWVTQAVVDEFNKHATNGEEVSTLADFARQVAEAYGFPHTAVMDKKGKDARTVKFSGHAKRAVFVPKSPETPEVTQATLGEGEK